MVGPIEEGSSFHQVGGSPVRPLRILTHSLFLDPVGGVELCTLQDSVALAARGHAIDLMYGAEGSFRSNYEESGVFLAGPISFDFDLRHPVGGFASFVKPARWARSRHPDVLWLNRFEHIFWAQSVARWSRCPIVCHLHHKPNFRRTKELSLGVAHFIAVSNFMRDSWVEAGIKPERISVVDNAVPKLQYPRGGIPERAAAREKLGIAPDVVVVLYYGWITQEKGVGTLLEAWAKLARDADRARLVLVGSPLTSEDAELDRQLRSIAPSSIQWFPMQSDVTPFLHAADLVVFPTWLDEGFGRVVIEGMSTGRPVIASRAGAVPEILSGPMARFLVEPRDSNELSAKIASLLDWRRTEPELAAACANWVDERYPFDGHVKAVEEVLLRYRRGRR